jgi:FtsH-binding integral membrane protein
MIKKILFSFIILALLAPVFVFAQGPPPSGPLKTAADEFETKFASQGANQIKIILLNIAEWFLVILGVIAIIVALWSAYLFLTASDNEEQLKKAKKTLIWAMVGVVVAIVAFSIVTFTKSLMSSPADMGSIQITKTV